jgi:hypothetical protein
MNRLASEPCRQSRAETLQQQATIGLIASKTPNGQETPASTTSQGNTHQQKTFCNGKPLFSQLFTIAQLFLSIICMTWITKF